MEQRNPAELLQERPTPYSVQGRSHQIDRHSLQTTMASINDALKGKIKGNRACARIPFWDESSLVSHSAISGDPSLVSGIRAMLCKCAHTQQEVRRSTYSVLHSEFGV